MNTRTFRIGLTILAFVFLPAAGLTADKQFQETESKGVDPRIFPDPKMAAEYGLDELKKIGLLSGPKQEIYAKSLGFLSAKETLIAKLGVGIRTYDVPLDQLKKFQGDHDPVALLIDIHEIIFPLLVEKQPRSSLTISELRPGKGWIVGKEGRSALIHLIESHRTSNDDNLIQIPALGLRFLGKRNNVYGNELVLTPLVDRSELEIQAGQAVLARDLFLELRKKVKIPREGGHLRRPSIGQ